MNTSTLESFISYCDDMMIAEEGFKDIKNNYKTVLTKVTSIKSQLKGEKNPKNALKYYNQIVKILSELKDSVTEMELSALDKGVGVITKITSITAALGAAIGTWKLAGKADIAKGGKGIGAGTAGAATYTLTDKTLSKIGGNPSKAKEAILSDINRQIERAELSVTTIKELIKNKIRLDDYGNEDYIAYNSLKLQEKKLKPIIAQLERELNTKMKYVLPKECVDKKYVFTSKLSDGFYIIYYTGTKYILNLMELEDTWDYQDKFEEIVRTFINRKKQDLTKLGCGNVVINNDDTLTAIIDLTGSGQPRRRCRKESKNIEKRTELKHW